MSHLNRGYFRILTIVTVGVSIFTSEQCSAVETLLSGFEGNLSTTLGLDWQFDGVSSAFVTTGATEGSQALQITHTRTQSIPLKLFGNPSLQYSTFLDNTQLKAEFTVPATANYREAFYRLQINGGAFTIDGEDMILMPGATVTGIWDYAADGVLAELAGLEPITGFSLQLGMRGPDFGSPVPPTSVTIVDNIRWFSPKLPGDFNSDSSVSAADYVVWRKTDGTNNPLPNDDDLGVPIRPEHYALWVANFGSSAAGASAAPGNASGVPEPSCLLLAISCSISLLLLTMRKRVVTA